MRKSQLLAAFKQEIQRHDFSPFVISRPQSPKEERELWCPAARPVRSASARRANS